MEEDINKLLLIASGAGDVDRTKELLDMGADVESRDDENWTPIMNAYHNEKMMDLLVRYDVNVNAKSLNGNTTLILINITEKGKQVISRIIKLLKYRADISIHNKWNKSCLDFNKTMWKENETIQKLIINKQPHNIKLFDDKIGILPQLKEKYKEIIELAEMGLF